ncbi:hypothetical protein NQF87_00905 [Bombella sp. TMW 2.2559]|uniref:Uncharacterized protein n=1 Tax=Bombella dulcis TaxID=2967339 RepID=A0ABT3WB16_9PROT|nr:hypothetical protein [Bombella dulcis]MCX5615544.1 hypothetical protein [Bombella dulcis]
MMTLALLAILWTLVWLLHLNGLPAYRRQNPCHLPPASRFQNHLLRLLPVLALVSACLMDGLDGLFLWAFTAPVTGILLGIILPLCVPAGRPRASGGLAGSLSSLNGQSLQKHSEAPKYLP